MEILKVTAVLLLIAALFFAAGVLYQKHASTRAMEELVYYKGTYLWKSGWAKGFGSYVLRSFDGGRSWYAVERIEDELKVLGPAEEVFPGLLSQLYGLDALVKYVEQNGPITLTGERARTDQAILEAAGFTVTEGPQLSGATSLFDRR